ncbi:hypothetical protein EV652_111207 [Kribbella steppae]|uniref:Uncharacterized protein n=1 Tax=Kribbella steppae TaxID=2512223 RepID=A0A4R2H5M7_9ACTN|nr:hypothetical protein [Kribbella steppae]TCO21297.1 hypothetical protein EV652_111207 [Kribbella steppae]
MGGLGTFLFLAYPVLVVAALLYTNGTLFALARGFAGLGVTILIMVSKPDRHPLDWTGAPVVALGLWVLAIIVSSHGRSATRA